MIEGGMTDTFRAETLFGGIHLPDHEYFMALYVDGIGPDTIEYSPAGEARGQGYQPGGKRVEGRTVQILDGVVCMDFRAPVWQVSTIRDVRGALIYNNSLPQKNSVCVVDFGEPHTSINGPFVPRLPEPGPQTSLIQWDRSAPAPIEYSDGVFEPTPSAEPE
jgi:hypothetical protein